MLKQFKCVYELERSRVSLFKQNEKFPKALNPQICGTENWFPIRKESRLIKLLIQCKLCLLRTSHFFLSGNRLCHSHFGDFSKQTNRRRKLWHCNLLSKSLSKKQNNNKKKKQIEVRTFVVTWFSFCPNVTQILLTGVYGFSYSANWENLFQ